MAARILYWIGFLIMSALCYLLLSVNAQLAEHNLALRAAVEAPREVVVDVWAQPDGSIAVMANGQIAAIKPGICGSIGYWIL